MDLQKMCRSPASHRAIAFRSDSGLLRCIDPPPNGNMLETSTASPLFFSALSFSPHRGMASMGKLLTICIASLMITMLIFLPAVLKFVKTRERNPSVTGSVRLDRRPIRSIANRVQKE